MHHHARAAYAVSTGDLGEGLVGFRGSDTVLVLSDLFFLGYTSALVSVSLWCCRQLIAEHLDLHGTFFISRVHLTDWRYSLFQQHVSLLFC